MFDSYKIEKEIFKLKPDDTVSLYILICDDIMENIAVRKLKGRPSSTGLSVWINYESDNDLQGYTGKDFQIRNFGKVMQGRGYSDHSRIVYVKNQEILDSKAQLYSNVIIKKKVPEPAVKEIDIASIGSG
jgi:hypothetical protein